MSYNHPVRNNKNSKVSIMYLRGASEPRFKFPYRLDQIFDLDIDVDVRVMKQRFRDTARSMRNDQSS